MSIITNNKKKHFQNLYFKYNIYIVNFSAWDESVYVHVLVYNCTTLYFLTISFLKINSFKNYISSIPNLWNAHFMFTFFTKELRFFNKSNLSTINYKFSPCNVVFNLKSPLGDTKPNNFSPIFFVLLERSLNTFIYCEPISISFFRK